MALTQDGVEFYATTHDKGDQQEAGEHAAGDESSGLAVWRLGTQAKEACSSGQAQKQPGKFTH